MARWMDRDKQTRAENKIGVGTSLAVQQLAFGAFTAMGLGSIPGQGTKIPQVELGKKKSSVMITVISILYS